MNGTCRVVLSAQLGSVTHGQIGPKYSPFPVAEPSRHMASTGGSRHASFSAPVPQDKIARENQDILRECKQGCYRAPFPPLTTMFSYRTLYVTSEHYVVLPRMYLMGSYFETGALGKVGVRSARQGAGSASTGADATVRIGGLASWPQRLRTDATVRMVLWMVRGP